MSQHWNIEDTNKLKTLITEGITDNKVLGEHLGRSPHSIACKRWTLNNPQALEAEYERRKQVRAKQKYGDNPFFVPPCFRPQNGSSEW